MLILRLKQNTKLDVTKSVADTELCTCVLGFYGVVLIIELSVLFSHTAGTKCMTVSCGVDWNI